MKATLKLQNNYSYLLNIGPEVIQKFWKVLRFRELGYQHSRLYKQHLWDGFTDFFSKKTGRFLTGLLPEVTGALRHWNIEYDIEDKRTETKFIYESIQENFLDQWWPKDMKKFDLYDFQVDLVNQAIKHKRGIICPPTGSGKTEQMIALLKCLPPNCPTLILANRKTLVEQNYDRLNKWGFQNFGRVYDKHNEPNVITCATVQSLHKIEKLLPHIKAVIVDEIHEMMSKTPKMFYNKLTNADIRIALSATWEKFGGKDKVQRYFVKGYFGPEFKTKSASADEKGIVKTGKLQDRGILSKSNCIFYNIYDPELLYDVYIDAVTNGIAKNFTLHGIVKRLAERCTGRTLILVERIAHGDTLAGLIPGSLWVAGRDDAKSRKQVIEKLSATGSNAIGIATSKIFSTGLDVKIHNLINVAGGKADHTIIQQMGRGLRLASDKEVLNYYDFMFKINPYLEKHSNIRVKILTKEGHNISVKDVDF